MMARVFGDAHGGERGLDAAGESDTAVDPEAGSVDPEAGSSVASSPLAGLSSPTARGSPGRRRLARAPSAGSEASVATSGAGSNSGGEDEVVPVELLPPPLSY